MTTQPKRLIARRDEAAALARGEVVEIRRACKFNHSGWLVEPGRRKRAWHRNDPDAVQASPWPIGSRWWVAEPYWGCDLPGYGDQPCVIYDDEWQGRDYMPAKERPWAPKFGRLSAAVMTKQASRTDAAVIAVRLERGEVWEWVITFKGEST